MSESTPTPGPAPTVWGTFQAHDARAVIEFLTAVGFEPTAVYADEGDPATVHHAQLDWPEGGGVMLGSHKPDAAWNREPGSAGFYVVTTDPRAVHDRVVAAGGRVLRQLATTDYGSTEFSMADPEGNLWSFGTYAGEPRRG